MKLSNQKYFAYSLFFVSFFLLHSLGFAQESNSITNFIDTVSESGQGMTLWQVLKSGGVVMIFLGILSMIMLSIVIYLLIKVNQKKMFPEPFTERLIEEISQGNVEKALVLSEENSSLLSSICMDSLKKKTKLKEQTEAIEDAARSEISWIWTQLNYLSEISQVAPMLGLLGTVLGMIQAFNTIAFDAAGVKPILLAGGVSKAMITTAAGLSIAIITIVFYSLLRVRVQKITDYTEAKVSQIVEALARTVRQD